MTTSKQFVLISIALIMLLPTAAIAACSLTTAVGVDGLHTTDCNPVSEVYHFLGSRGAYATEATLLGLPSGNRCALNTTSGTTCLKSTGTCSPAVAPATGCSADPSAQPGEISCWCHPPLSIAAIGTINQSTNYYFKGWLSVDTNLDSVPDYEMCAGGAGTQGAPCRSTPTRPFRLYRVQPEFYRIEWEDAFFNGFADFNDYMIGWEMRDCRPAGQSRFPESAQTNASCTTVCSRTCNDAILSIVNSHIKVSASVSIDTDRPETPRESNNRLVQTTVNVYSDFLAKDPLLSKNFAICPVVNFSWRTAPGRANQVIPTIHGLSGCGGTATPLPGTPTCLPPIASDIVFPVAASKQQMRTTRFCGAYDQKDETFRFAPASTCAGAQTLPQMRSQLYEFRMDDIDSSLPISLKFGLLSIADILPMVESVDVFLFWDIQNGAVPFICPSGPGVIPADASSGVASVFKYHVDRTSNALNVFQRL